MNKFFFWDNKIPSQIISRHTDTWCNNNFWIRIWLMHLKIFCSYTFFWSIIWIISLISIDLFISSIIKTTRIWSKHAFIISFTLNIYKELCFCNCDFHFHSHISLFPHHLLHKNNMNDPHELHTKMLYINMHILINS